MDSKEGAVKTRIPKWGIFLIVGSIVAVIAVIIIVVVVYTGGKNNSGVVNNSGGGNGGGNGPPPCVGDLGHGCNPDGTVRCVSTNNCTGDNVCICANGKSNADCCNSEKRCLPRDQYSDSIPCTGSSCDFTACNEVMGSWIDAYWAFPDGGLTECSGCPQRGFNGGSIIWLDSTEADIRGEQSTICGYNGAGGYPDCKELALFN